MSELAPLRRLRWVSTCIPDTTRNAAGPYATAQSLLVEMGSSGETLAIVQPADQNFEEGEKVRVYTRSDGSARVAKL